VTVRPSRSHLPTLDMQMVEGLRELGIWEEVSSEVIEELPGRIAALENAITQNSFVEVEHLAHSAKGTCGAIGAASLSSMFGRIEEMAESEALFGVQEVLLAITEEVSLLRRAVPVVQPSGASMA